MKERNLFMMTTCLLLMIGTLHAQLRLDVEGDAKIRGKLDLEAGTANVFIGQSAGGSNIDGVFNTFLGAAAGESNTNGQANTFMGFNAGAANTSGSVNTFLGVNSGYKNEAGSDNTLVGSDAGFNNTNGNNNTFIGREAGYDNINGFENTYLGRETGRNNISGSNNTFVGSSAGINTTNSTKSTYLGNSAGQANSDSLSRSMAIGYNAKVDCSNCAVIGGIGEDAVRVGIGTTDPLHLFTLESDLGFGTVASFINTSPGGKAYSLFSTGEESPEGAGCLLFLDEEADDVRMMINPEGKIGIGTTDPQQALHVLGGVRIEVDSLNGFGDLLLDVEGDTKIRGKLNLEAGTGTANIFIGQSAGGSNIDGVFNTFLGAAAGESNTNGQANTFMGFNAGAANTSGSVNTFLGVNSGYKNEAGSDNTLVGSDAGFNNTNGNNNTFIGREAGYDNINGFENTYLGRETGRNNISGSNNTFVGSSAGINTTNSTKSTYLGNSAGQANSDSLSRSMAIGYNAKVDCSNCAVIGGIGEDAVRVGIGTTDPLHLFTLESDLGFGTVASFINTSPGGKAYSLFSTGEESPEGAGCLLFLDEEADDVRMMINPEGKIGIGTTDPQQALHVLGRVRLESVPEGSGDLLLIDSNGDLVRSVGGARIVNDNANYLLISEQRELIEKLEEANQSQQKQIDDLNSILQKLVSNKEVILKGPSYVLPLEQKNLLAQNQPNPFYQNTMIEYFISKEVQDAKIQITSTTGKVLGTVVINEIGKGQVTIKASTYPTGTYYYSLVLDGQVMETKRMVLTR